MLKNLRKRASDGEKKKLELLHDGHLLLRDDMLDMGFCKSPPFKPFKKIRFEQLPLARSVLRLISMYPSDIRSDSPTSSWFKYVHEAAHEVWGIYENNGMDDSFNWSKIEVYCMIQTMKKSPRSGVARTTYTSIMKGQGSCARGGCLTKTGLVHTDHIIETANGGSNDLSNWQLCCDSCNCSKGNKRNFQKVSGSKLWN